MRIERVTRYAVDGKEFTSLAKAQDHIDGMINKALQNIFTGGDGRQRFSVSDCIVITEALLGHKEFFADLLSVELPDSDGNY